jgi:phenylacetate-CoA ligase
MSTTSLHERASGGLFFPLTQYCYNRKGIGGQLRQSLAIEREPTDVIAAAQMNSLKAVLRHAARNVPYYGTLMRKIGLEPDSIRTAEDMRRIPPLSREDLLNNRLDLVDERYRKSAIAADKAGRPPGAPSAFAGFRRRHIVRNTSSGSTGSPTVFYENGTVSSASWANELRLRRWFNLGPGASEARFARVTPEFRKGDTGNRLRRFFWNQLALPGINLTDTEYAFIADQLRRYKPKVFWGFTAAIAGLASFLKNTPEAANGIEPRLIITWAAPLYDHEKAIISEVFRCPVSNIYGMRETGHIGAYCPHGSLHVFQNSHFLEVDDTGEILITFLRPAAMPFIRYRTGDIGELGDEQCACGRTLQVIKKLHGRTGEIFMTQDGRMFSPNFWCRTFMAPRLAGCVKRFQIVYGMGDAITIRLVAAPSDRREAEDDLKAVVAGNFGARTRVFFEYPDAIAPRLTGKYQMVINEGH